MVEEAAELAIEAVRSDRSAAVMEAADLVYNLVVLLEGMDIPSTMCAASSTAAAGSTELPRGSRRTATGRPDRLDGPRARRVPHHLRLPM